MNKLRILSMAALGAGLLLLIAAQAQGQGNPGGNNGTVKIDGVDFDDHPNNEPHPGCVFQIDFYGYDESDLTANYVVELQPPTAGGTLADGTVDIGGDPAGGGTDLDGSVTLDLASELAASGVDPHPNHGYHVKLTVNAEGSRGADKKHKVFWIDCEEVEPTTEPTEEPTEEPTVLPTETESPTPTVQPTVEETEDEDAAVLGTTERRKKKAPEVLATTGASVTMAWLGVLFVVMGLALRRARGSEPVAALAGEGTAVADKGVLATLALIPILTAQQLDRWGGEDRHGV